MFADCYFVLFLTIKIGAINMVLLTESCNFASDFEQDNVF